MQVIKYEEILDTLGELDTWLTGLGIEPKHDRIHKALDSLRKAQTNTEKVKAGEEPERIDNAEEFYFGIVEALDFYDIYRAFKNEPAKVLRPKLEVALSGPFLPRDETKENSAGRKPRPAGLGGVRLLSLLTVLPERLLNLLSNLALRPR